MWLSFLWAEEYNYALCEIVNKNRLLSLIKQRLSKHRSVNRLAQGTLAIRKNDHSSSVEHGEHGWSSQIFTEASAMPLSSQKQNVSSATSGFSHCFQKLTEI